jgi:hypothetical protein
MTYIATLILAGLFLVAPSTLSAAACCNDAKCCTGTECKCCSDAKCTCEQCKCKKAGDKKSCG